MSKKEFRKNQEIQAAEVLLIDHTGQKRGVTPTDQALALASEFSLDLVEVGPLATPPVCKIVNFGKLQYEKEKQQRKSKTTAKRAGEVKGIRLSVKIGEHDMMVRVKAGQKFLDKGYKIKPELQLRGREKAHPELAQVVLEKYIGLLEREVVVEQPVKRQGARFATVVANKKKGQ